MIPASRAVLARIASSFGPSGIAGPLSVLRLQSPGFSEESNCRLGARRVLLGRFGAALLRLCLLSDSCRGARCVLRRGFACASARFVRLRFRFARA
eukprot:11548303-Alexandrium_andersonii.AAC.1